MRNLSRLFIAPTLMLLSTIVPGQAGDDVIRVDSSIVVLNASVTDGSGKPVRALEQKLFHIYEDGVEQPIASFGAEDSPFAAVILLDTSGSMANRVSLARAAALEFLRGLRSEDMVAIYKFDSKVELVQDFGNTRDMRDRFYDLQADGMTVLNDAVFAAAEALVKRPEKRRAIIVLSDGADTLSKRSADKALRAALAADATVYTVDMSDPNLRPGQRVNDRAVLKKFAEKTGGQFIATPGGVAMREAFQRIVEDLGVQYTLAYEPSNGARDGKWRALELRIARPNLYIRTRKGYNAPSK